MIGQDLAFTITIIIHFTSDLRGVIQMKKRVLDVYKISEKYPQI